MFTTLIVIRYMNLKGKERFQLKTSKKKLRPETHKKFFNYLSPEPHAEFLSPLPHADEIFLSSAPHADDLSFVPQAELMVEFFKLFLFQSYKFERAIKITSINFKLKKL